MPAPKLLEQVRLTARLRHLSLRTEKTYAQQIKRFVIFHGKRHPRELDETHIRDYLSYLASERNVAASTQNVALAALIFLYKDVLKQPLNRIENVQRARVSRHLPVVLTRLEVKGVLSELRDVSYLAAGLMRKASFGSRPRRGFWVKTFSLQRSLSLTQHPCPISTSKKWMGRRIQNREQ